MSYEVQAIDRCTFGAAVAAFPQNLPAYALGLDGANCVSRLTPTAFAALYGNNNGDGRIAEDPSHYRYDDVLNRLYVGVSVAGTGVNGLSIGQSNTANGARASILAGINNTDGANDSVIGGGNGNTIGAASTVAIIGSGTSNNLADSTNGAIVGGATNQIGNTSASPNAFIGGGQGNQINTTNLAGLAVIGGGINNQVNRARSTIGGGNSNIINTGSAFIGGGQANQIQLPAVGNSGFEVIAGGFTNLIGPGASQLSVIAGGFTNTIDNCLTGVISGGTTNLIRNANASGILSGSRHQLVGGIGDVIAGGEDNQSNVPAPGSGIAGGNNGIFAGSDHRISGSVVESAIGGGQANEIRALAGNASPIGNYQAYIGGGQRNIIRNNLASTGNLDACTIGGGQDNVIDIVVPTAAPDGYAVIAGGVGNVLSGLDSACTGGAYNIIQGAFQRVGGYYNSPQGAAGAYAPNDYIDILGNGSAVTRRNAYVWQHDATLIWQPNTQVPAAASNAAAITALTAAKPVATHNGAMTRVDIGGAAAWFVCDGTVWKFAF